MAMLDDCYGLSMSSYPKRASRLRKTDRPNIIIEREWFLRDENGHVIDQGLGIVLWMDLDLDKIGRASCRERV